MQKLIELFRRSMSVRGVRFGLVACVALMAVPVRAQDAPTAPAEVRPTVNFYGLPGLMDMPEATAQPDGELTLTTSYFGGIARNTLAFQLSPRISGAFRYASIRDWNSDGFDTYYDRSFDVRFQLLFETERLPGVAVGLQDFAGTGILAGEYLVATKNFPRQGLTLTGGLGWGRLGSYNAIGSLIGSRPSFDAGDTGGELSYDQWFRGPVAPFAGVEWRPNDRWGFKFEYSSDAYVQEAERRDVFERRSPFNFGVEYQVSDSLRLGAYGMYGDTFGVLASFTFNPARRDSPLVLRAPPPFPERPKRNEYPELWEANWLDRPDAEGILGQRMADALEAEGVTVLGFEIDAVEARILTENNRYRSTPNAIGRIARVMAAVLPISVETFSIVLVDAGLPISRVVMRRSDLERLAPLPDAAEQLRPLVGIATASSTNLPKALPDIYPRFDCSIGPYFRQALFDPQNPILLEFGARVQASYEFAPGLILSGSVAQEVLSDFDQIRVSDSNLPPVRTLAGLYEQGSGPVIENLTASYVRGLGNNFFGRASAGIFERMYGGVSGEILWKPVSSRLGLGVEVNYARQRDFDGLFGFRDYDVITGHASAYYDWGGGYFTQIDAGRYLAGDWGATFTLDREFSNGWKVGAFATFTNVSAEDFGEGSFYKGVRLTIPLSYITGQPTKNTTSTVLRPIQRDGGARMNVPGRLYERVRSGDVRRLDEEWARVWR